MKILAARKYPNPRNGPLSRAETEPRRLAYAIKDPRSPACQARPADLAEILETLCAMGHAHRDNAKGTSLP